MVPFAVPIAFRPGTIRGLGAGSHETGRYLW